MKRFIAIFLAVVFTFTLGLAGCGQNQSSGKTAEPTAEDKSAGTESNAPASAELSGSISYMTWGDNTERGLYQQVIDDFQKKNSKVKVKYVYTPNEYNQKLQTMVAGNTAPDVFWILQNNVPTYAPTGACEVLDPWIEKNPELTDDMVDGLLKYGQYEGKTYAIPKDWEPVVMYLNEDLFKAANVPLPTSDWTMDDYVSLAQKLTVTKDGKTSVYGAQCDTYWAFWMVFAGNCGGKFFKDGKSNFSDPNVIKGLSVLNDLINKYKAAPSPAAMSSMSGQSSSSDQMFATGKIAMYPSGRWQVPPFRKDCKFNWTAVEMPKGVTRVNPVISGCLAVSSKSRNKEAAVAFVKHILSRDGLKITMSNGLAMPVYKKYLDDPELVTAPPDVAPFKATANYIETELQYTVYQTKLFSKYNDMITAELDNAFNGKQTMEQACANIDKKANTELFK